ncbi:galactose-1-phosphate uridylyltransferase [Nocardiopsis flavescens]|uniref:Galactose-1-phosphate uridylyltransferase n=1 Tax=Nocardiopsis flavescens TaxID=758803 RepID=A0A1M6NY57_9ACTN|nr:galactose-1-phosphate uridylyltransferase [Nocardiopsis flavescens]SHK00582.1 UDPglucose--hexose-1-phosphate uridylyltransferase [Nocardiopsis flavescens]
MSRTAADGVRTTTARLADGREIVYFDEGGGPPRVPVPDRRDLPPFSAASELRFDPLLREWVIVASHRQTRTHMPAADACPLCPSTADRTTEVPDGDYDVVVFENRFPSLSAAGGPPPDGPDGPGEAGPDRRPGTGRCEVVVFGPDHDASFADLTPRRVRTVLEAWTQRTRALSALPGTEQVYCFENRGAEIGVTLPHPHGQVYALPFVAPRTRRVLESAREHRERTGRDLFSDVLDAERRSGLRSVAAGEHWTAFVPAAARWPVEVHVYPNRPVPDLPALTDAERDDFGPLYLDVLRRLDALFGMPLPYIAAWHQAPVRTGRDLSRLRLEVFSVRRSPDRLKYLAGAESGMGVFINDVPPETTARRLREAAP